jgi:hypothetical protein
MKGDANVYAERQGKTKGAVRNDGPDGGSPKPMKKLSGKDADDLWSGIVRFDTDTKKPGNEFRVFVESHRGRLKRRKA